MQWAAAAAGRLILEDGSEHTGRLFGAVRPAAGEVVFNTAMTGYPESLSDPSYTGQILVITYPLVGNYGVPEPKIENGVCANYESEAVRVAGLVIADYSGRHSHWAARAGLGDWLAAHGVPGLSGVDTRALTQRLRTHGALLGRIVPEGDAAVGPWRDPNREDLVAQVSTRSVQIHGDGRRRIVLLDCGVKHNILRCLLRRDATVVRVPWDHDFTAMDFDGLVVSNGPGDPARCAAAVAHLRAVLAAGRPVFGICLGHQLLALAAGARTYKLAFGHRGHNQPVGRPGTPRAFITSQNHGFAVDPAGLDDRWEPLYVNLNDGTNEGLRHRTRPFFSVQFHPEASGGPTDTEFLFDDFMDLVRHGR